MRFNCGMTHADWNEEEQRWMVGTTQGTTYSAKYLVTALGLLSAINWPAIDGLEVRTNSRKLCSH